MLRRRWISMASRQVASASQVCRVLQEVEHSSLVLFGLHLAGRLHFSEACAAEGLNPIDSSATILGIRGATVGRQTQEIVYYIEVVINDVTTRQYVLLIHQSTRASTLLQQTRLALRMR